MREQWRRLGPEALPGPAAVARPQALLDGMAPSGPPVASWSTVTRPALVLGRAARDPAINDTAVEDDGIDVVHRRSGGGPVLWDPDLLSLDVVLPPGHRLAHRDVALAYRWIGEILADALTGLGAGARAVGLEEARAAQRRDDPMSRRAARACFGGLSPFEVVGPDGRKLVGLSQVRRRTGSLFQCGIPITFDGPRLARMLEPDPAEAEALAEALGAAATGLRTWLPRVTPREVVDAVEEALARREDVALHRAG